MMDSASAVPTFTPFQRTNDIEKLEAVLSFEGKTKKKSIEIACEQVLLRTERLGRGDSPSPPASLRAG